MKDLRIKIVVFLLLLAGIGAAFFLVPEKRPFQSYVHRAEEFYQKKNFNRAVELYLQALKIYPNHERTPEILLAIGDTYNYSLGNLEKAGKAYDMLTTKYPKTVSAMQGFQNAGEMYEKAEDYEKALLAYQGILDNFPGAPNLDQTRFKVAMMALKLKKFEPAIRSLMAIIDKNPQTPIADQVLYQLGTTFFMEGALPDSVKVLETAVEKYPQSPLNNEMKFTLANGYEEIGQFEKALKIYQDILPNYPNPKVVQKKIEKIQERLKETKAFRQNVLAHAKPESMPMKPSALSEKAPPPKKKKEIPADLKKLLDEGMTGD